MQVPSERKRRAEDRPRRTRPVKGPSRSDKTRSAGVSPANTKAGKMPALHRGVGLNAAPKTRSAGVSPAIHERTEKRRERGLRFARRSALNAGPKTARGGQGPSKGPAIGRFPDSLIPRFPDSMVAWPAFQNPSIESQAPPLSPARPFGGGHMCAKKSEKSAIGVAKSRPPLGKAFEEIVCSGRKAGLALGLCPGYNGGAAWVLLIDWTG